MEDLEIEDCRSSGMHGSICDLRFSDRELHGGAQAPARTIFDN